MAYNGTVDLIAGIRQKNNGTFPLVDAPAVRVTDDLRLDTALNNIENSMGTINDQVGELKIQLNEVANIKSGVTGTANTWETIPYTIRAGRTYVIHNNSSDATMTVRTRATADGSTVDAPDAVGPTSSVSFTASADANFLRIISTKASTPWEIDEQGTAISDIEATLKYLDENKLDNDDYKSETTGTCTASNTFYTFPFKIKSGETYVFSVIDSGNTMSFRTRYTEDGSAVDSYDAIVYGVPKTFTASGDANYLRVNSYLANGSFKISKYGTIDFEMHEIADQKLDVLVYKNETTGTCTASGTFYNFPYKIKNGKAYKCHTLDVGNTMSFRTRATADGDNIDSLNSVAYGSPQSFTATSDANFIRVQSYLSNGSFKIEEEGTIQYEIAELQPQVPLVNLPEKLYAVTGRELNVYFDNIVENGDKYKYNLACAVGKQMQRGFQFNPGNNNRMSKTVSSANVETDYTFAIKEGDTYVIEVTSETATMVFSTKQNGATVQTFGEIAHGNRAEFVATGNANTISVTSDQAGQTFVIYNTEAGEYDFSIDILNDKNEIVASAESTLIVSPPSAGENETVSFILLGDSTVAGTDTQVVADFNGDAMEVSSLGTRGTSPAAHEGRTGWTFQYYYNSAEQGGVSNPFYNPTSHLFDADYYFTNSSIDKPDWFFIQLGINDVFLITDEGILNAKINSMVTQCDYMITSILSASPSTKIGIAVTIPPNYSQDAFGKAYGCGQTRERYKRNNMLWVKRVLEKYSDKESQGIYLVPICTNLDTIYNMGLESTPVNARNTSITYQSPIANGGVHPVESGYQQLADVYMAFLKANV